MAKYAIEGATLTAIADAIRSKTGAAETITPEQVPEQVEAVYNLFFDKYQVNGNRKEYAYAFAGSGWTDETFQARYDIRPISASNMFHGARIKNLPEVLARQGVVLDFADCTEAALIFSASGIEVLGDCNFQKVGRFYNEFSSAAYLREIGTIYLAEDGTQTFTQMFTNTPALETVTFEGTIGRNGFSVSSSPLLTHDSLMSIIHALADYSRDESGTVWTVTLGETNLAKLTEEEIGIAEGKGWVLA